ncbi:hypothetical protein OE88DRAFT_1295427 [Heliocybe sulcata]|uniref:Uncharacterized protein n=1 Tax=Heliocybe sulcata TaxID=5364 RepID=A0A5C3NGT5_9AGAM|nr:hypothetical protein OE88DRAFT_1295427 [Heliocybe sulcata]
MPDKSTAITGSSTLSCISASDSSSWFCDDPPLAPNTPPAASDVAELPTTPKPDLGHNSQIQTRSHRILGARGKRLFQTQQDHSRWKTSLSCAPLIQTTTLFSQSFMPRRKTSLISF